jgi:hypothetical protein
VYSASDRPVRYADCPAVCVDCPAAWPDYLVMYLICSALCADCPNWLFRVCAGCGGLGVDFGNSVGKTGLAVDALDDPRSPLDGPAVQRSVGLPLICVGSCGCPGYVSISIRKGVGIGHTNL